MKLRLLAAGLLLALPMCTAFAQDEKVLSTTEKDDIEFAKALTGKGYPDLAERLLAIVEKKYKSAEASAAIRALKLDIAQETAGKIEDVIKRKDALVKVLEDKLKFIDEAKGTTAAEDMRHVLPDLYNQIGETITSAIKKEKDDKVLDALRNQGDSIFQRAEAVMKQQIEDLKKNTAPTPDEEYSLQAARYNYARTLYFHALIFAAGSGKRTEFCNAAIAEFQEFDLDYNDQPLNFFGYIETGNCYREIGNQDEALKMFDLAIKVREFYGDQVKGVWPIPRDIVDIVSYAKQQKMILLREQKQFAKVVEEGKDFFSTTPEPWESAQAMVLGKEMAEAQLSSGDMKGAAETADTMIKIDPNGIGGFWGREIRDRSGEGSFADKLKSAEGKIALNELDRGISLCRQVMYDTAGTPDEASAGCEALLLIGFAYQRKNWVEEASLVYQTALDRFPKAKGAPEALVRAIECYAQAAGKTGKRKYYKEHIEENTNRLIRDYPNDPRAADIQMLKAKNLESEGDFPGAIEIYKGVLPTSTNYTKALLMIGIDYFNHALKIAQDPKTEDQAKPFYPLAEEAFKKAIAAIGTARGTTIDPKILSAYSEQEYLATMSLSKLYMLNAFGRISEAGGVVDTLEQKWGGEAAKAAEIQNLRGKIFLSQGKYEEAEKWVDDLYKRDRKAAAGPAGQLARELDRQGVEKRAAKPGSAEADDLWRRAARFYYISIKPQVDGVASQDAGEMTAVGNRLYIYGEHFNGVPEGRMTSWVDWVPGSKTAPEYFVKAAEIYEAALAQTPDYRMTINLGRCYGYLKRWVDAARIYSKLFEQEVILNAKDKRKLDSNLTRAKPELVPAYLEFGVAERLAAGADGQKDRLLRCRDVILAPLMNSLNPETFKAIYWAANYQYVRTLMDRGDYNDGMLSVENTQRQVSPTFDDDKWGYKTLFEATIAELKEKLRK